MADIHKAGLLVIREGRVLLCRKKHGTQSLILPGGKLEPGESAAECLSREIREELGTGVLRAEFVATYVDQAAMADGEVRRTVRIDLYHGELTGEPRAQAEIAELVWFGPDDDWSLLSPSLRNQILPDLASGTGFSLSSAKKTD
jgi:8-oxo-dGTP pyrophosphatase MutT (NUDIX family)